MPPATAQPEDAQAWASRRLVKGFTFEDTDDAGVPLGRTQPLPMHWYAIGRAADTADANFHSQPLHQALQQAQGFPHFTRVAYTERTAYEGDFSLKLGLNGGNAGAYVEIGALSAIPGSEYLVEAQVQTDGLKQSRAYLEAYFVDARGQVIEASRRRSPPLTTGGRWEPVAVTLPGVFNTAAWIGIEVKLLQPEPDPDAPLGRHQIVLHDVKGNAWFDNIRVWQVPSVTVRTPSRTRIIRDPVQPELRINVRDLTGHRLLAHLRARDEHGQVLDHQTRVIGGGAPMQWRWRPKLPRFGYYRLELEIHETQGPYTGIIERVDTDLLWVPETRPSALTDLNRFVLSGEGLPPAAAELIPEVLETLGLYGVTLSLWDEQTTLDEAEARVEWLSRLTQPLLSQGRRVDLSLHPLPHELTDRAAAQAGDALTLLSGPDDAWTPYAGPVFRLFGQRADRWHLGPTRTPTAFDSLNADGVTIAAAHDALSKRVATPRTVVPWDMLQLGVPPAPEGSAFWLSVDPSIDANRIAGYLEPWPIERTGVLIRPMPVGPSPHETRIADLIKRMLFAWQAQTQSIALPPAFEWVQDRFGYLKPDPVLGVFAQTAHRLAGRRVIGEMNVVPGIRCLILEPDAVSVGHHDAGNGGMLVAWNESAPPGTDLKLYLGRSPIAYDPWGNTLPIEADDHQHTLPLTGTPLFVENIDAKLAMLRAAFKVEPPFIAASQRRHRRTLVLSNPWPYTVTGELTIRGPKDWLIQPSRHHFSIAAGQQADLQVAMTMPASEVAGDKHLLADITLHAGKPIKAQLTAPMQVGLETVKVTASLAIQANGNTAAPDLVTTLSITNTGTQPQSFYAFASMYGSPRQEQFVSSLQPSETVHHQFYFKGKAANILQHAIRTGVRETRGPAMLNLRLTREDLE